MDWQGWNGAAAAHTELVYWLVEGMRVVVVPATGKRGLHTLGVTGYRVTTVDNSRGAAVDQRRILQVSCTTCAQRSVICTNSNRLMMTFLIVIKECAKRKPAR